jgi:hypothetical protein
MKVILKASTGARIHVWRDDDLFHAAREDVHGQPQICLGVDLFEVIAEMAGLDLEQRDQAKEATRLAAEAQRSLPHAPEPDEAEQVAGADDGDERPRARNR